MTKASTPPRTDEIVTSVTASEMKTERSTTVRNSNREAYFFPRLSSVSVTRCAVATWFASESLNTEMPTEGSDP